MGGGAAALSEYNASNGSRSHTLTEMIKKGAEYLSSTKLKFSSMVYLGTLWIVSVQSGTKLESLPKKLCGLLVFIEMKSRAYVVKKLL
jgi:4-hydroxybenzoate polyprenyltransferase